jgi:PAS domain S-box-containing protein
MRTSLDALIVLIERLAPGMRGSVLLLDDDGMTLRHGAAPHLPDAYCRLIDGERIGPAAGSCGTAAYRRERVIVREIATDPLWANYRAVAEPFGLAACWSTPIIDVGGRILGTFAMYYDEPRDPTAADIELTDTATLLSANIITRARAARALRVRAESAELLSVALEEREQQLRTSHARLRAALDASSTSTWEWDVHTNAVDCDEGLYRLFGVDPAQRSGSFELFVSHIHPDDRDRVIAAARRCAAEGVDLDEEFRTVRSDGTIRWAVDKGKVVIGDDGKPSRLIGACVDITERRVREEQFHALAESIPQLAWMADAEGAIYWYNQRWYEYTGTTLAEVRGWGWTAVHHPDHVARVVERIQHSWNTGDPWEDTFPLRGKDGRYRWFLSRAQPIRDADGKIVRWFGTNTDINELREAELARDHALAQAEVANRAKSEFLAAMSHDLRTPLNAIGGYADLVADGIYGPVTDAQHAAMGRIRRAKDHLLALINDILNFARIEAGRVDLHIDDVSLNDAISSAVAMIEPQAARKGLSLRTCLSTDDVRVRADWERLTQILTNLLTNAVKFTIAGSITVELDIGESAVYIAVRDTGRGIPVAKLATVFEPFVQVGSSAEEQRQGVGLGLAISRKLARAMGGDLTVQSVLSEGTTFTLRIPRGTDARGA